MITSSKIQLKAEHKVKIKNVSLLKNAVIYGANASGKSNLIKVFRFVQYCLKNAVPINCSEMYCKTEQANEAKPSSFELTFTDGNLFYAYGFSVLLKNRKIVAEWLYQINKDDHPKVLFERQENQKPQLGDMSEMDEADVFRIRTYLEDFDEKSSTLFLSFMNRDKKYLPESKLSYFSTVYHWLVDNIDVFSPSSSVEHFEYYYDTATLELINKVIQVFDTGISEVFIKEISLDEMENELPSGVFKQIMEDLRERLDLHEEKKIRASLRYRDSFFNVSSSEDGRFNVTTINLRHRQSSFDFKFREESDGTRKIFDLLDILLNKSENKVYVIDELERSLHPNLTVEFIKLLNKRVSDKRVQLIFTTHETSILGQDLFRRDEIWFVEKDSANQSRLYSLDRFKERYDKVLRKAYLEGRYGAIPNLMTFDFEED